MQRIIAKCIGNRNAFAYTSDKKYCAAVGASALESANVVGYQTYDASLTDDMATIGVTFSNVATVGGDYTITDTMFGRTVEDNDQILVWDNDNYNLINYTYYDGVGWYITDALGDESPAVESDVAIPAGTGAYFLPADDRTWTVTFNY